MFRLKHYDNKKNTIDSHEICIAVPVSTGNGYMNDFIQYAYGSGPTKEDAYKAFMEDLDKFIDDLQQLKASANIEDMIEV